MSEPFDDETLELLNAYLDGEIEGDALRGFEARLAREPALRALLERMRGLDGELTAGLGDTPQSPPSDALMAAVRAFAQAHEDKPAVQTGNVVGFQPRKKAVHTQSYGWGMPLAAGVALFVGAGAMWMVQKLPGPATQFAAVSLTDGVVSGHSPLYAALETAESGVVIKAGPEKIRPILSFVAKDGRFCREFETFGDKGSVVGVACKGGHGWKMEVLLSAAPHAPEEGQYAPASGFNVKALDDVVSQLMEGQSLSPDAEKAARDKAWRKGN